MAKERGKIHARTHKITQRLAQFKKLLYLCTRNLIVCHNLKKDHETTSPRRRGVFFVAFSRFYVVKLIKNQKKSKKIKKNTKKCKKICTYQKIVVPLHRQMKKTPISNPKSNPKN